MGLGEATEACEVGKAVKAAYIVRVWWGNLKQFSTWSPCEDKVDRRKTEKMHRDNMKIE